MNTNIQSNGEDHAYHHKEQKSLPDCSEPQPLKINALTRQKEVSNQKKRMWAEASIRAAWRQLKGEGERCARGRWGSRLDHARPCTPINNFKSSEQREATKRSAQGGHRQHHSARNTEYQSRRMPVQSLQANLQIPEVHSQCIHTQKKSIFYEIKNLHGTY